MQSNSVTFTHIPVLFNECMNSLDIKQGGIYVDCTAGGGGHSRGILKALNGSGKLLSFDKDEDALETCQKSKAELNASNWEIVKTDYSDIAKVLDDMNIDRVDGILADLGVSSHQLDVAQRGFSYMSNGPLDMRMDQDRELTAAIVVNTYTKEQLLRIFKEYGEEKYSKMIAEGIVRDRVDKPFTTTKELADKIITYVPAKARNEKQHPARRCFQAIRIEVNDELQGVKKLLFDAPLRLKGKGRMAVITFHSLEDRLVKDRFKELENPCTCPREFPYCVCGKTSEGQVVTKKPIIATDEENERNFRAHSAKLRVFERKSMGV